jgi:hypothetical protein
MPCVHAAATGLRWKSDDATTFAELAAADQVALRDVAQAAPCLQLVATSQLCGWGGKAHPARNWTSSRYPHRDRNLFERSAFYDEAAWTIADTGIVDCDGGRVTQLRLRPGGGNGPDCGIVQLPDSICDLDQLWILDVSANRRLTQLPSCLGKMKALKMLNFPFSGMTSLPSSMGDLKQLIILHAFYSRLKELPDSFGNGKSMEMLILDGSLRSFPASFCQLTQLHLLQMQKQPQFRRLPECFGSLRKLEWLDLSYSGLEALPASISNLTKLDHISLTHNALKSLPENFGGMGGRLKELLLEGNLLESLPASLGNLTGLKTLEAGSNPLSQLTSTDLSKLVQGMGSGNLEVQNDTSVYSGYVESLNPGTAQMDKLSISLSASKPAAAHTVVNGADWLSPPLKCRIGDECIITLEARTSTSVALNYGGMNFSVTLDGEHHAAATDMKTGAYSVAVPEQWQTRVGQHALTFQHGTGTTLTFCDHREEIITSCRAPFGPPGGLREMPLDVLPIDCSANPLKKTSLDGVLCIDRSCPKGEYDATGGVLHCFTFDFEPRASPVLGQRPDGKVKFTALTQNSQVDPEV